MKIKILQVATLPIYWPFYGALRDLENIFSKEEKSALDEDLQPLLEEIKTKKVDRIEIEILNKEKDEAILEALKEETDFSIGITGIINVIESEEKVKEIEDYICMAFPLIQKIPLYGFINKNGINETKHLDDPKINEFIKELDISNIYRYSDGTTIAKILKDLEITKERKPINLPFAEKPESMEENSLVFTLDPWMFEGIEGWTRVIEPPRKLFRFTSAIMRKDRVITHHSSILEGLPLDHFIITLIYRLVNRWVIKLMFWGESLKQIEKVKEWLKSKKALPKNYENYEGIECWNRVSRHILHIADFYFVDITDPMVLMLSRKTWNMEEEFVLNGEKLRVARAFEDRLIRPASLDIVTQRERSVQRKLWSFLVLLDTIAHNFGHVIEYALDKINKESCDSNVKSDMTFILERTKKIPIFVRVTIEEEVSWGWVELKGILDKYRLKVLATGLVEDLNVKKVKVKLDGINSAPLWAVLPVDGGEETILQILANVIRNAKHMKKMPETLQVKIDVKEEEDTYKITCYLDHDVENCEEIKKKIMEMLKKAIKTWDVPEGYPDMSGSVDSLVMANFLRTGKYDILNVNLEENPPLKIECKEKRLMWSFYVWKGDQGLGEAISDGIPRYLLYKKGSHMVRTVDFDVNGMRIEEMFQEWMCKWIGRGIKFIFYNGRKRDKTVDFSCDSTSEEVEFYHSGDHMEGELSYTSRAPFSGEVDKRNLSSYMWAEAFGTRVLIVDNAIHKLLSEYFQKEDIIRKLGLWTFPETEEIQQEIVEVIEGTDFHFCVLHLSWLERLGEDIENIKDIVNKCRIIVIVTTRLRRNELLRYAEKLREITNKDVRYVNTDRIRLGIYKFKAIGDDMGVKRAITDPLFYSELLKKGR